jgi:hypothetical protein
MDFLVDAPVCGGRRLTRELEMRSGTRACALLLADAFGTSSPSA